MDMLDDRVMDASQRKLYMYERKVPADPAARESLLKELKRIIIHNGYHTAEIRADFERFGIEPELYYPGKSTEPHFFDRGKGNLHVVNSRGEIRLTRDLDLFKVVKEIIPGLQLDIKEYHSSRLQARLRFREFAYQKAESVFQSLTEGNILEEVEKRDRLTLLFGPHVSLPAGLETGAEQEDDYLNYRVLIVGEEPVVSFDYIFADQARYILEQVCFLLNATGKEMDVRVFHYGKVGLLADETEVGHIVVPNASLDEKSILAGKKYPFPIYNRLLDPDINPRFSAHIGEQPYAGSSVNTISVLQQRISNLVQVKAAGGSFLDMEWGPMAGLVQGFPSSYPNIKGIELYFAGVGSDKPLNGATLGETKYPRQKEKAVVQGYLQMIKDWR